MEKVNVLGIDISNVTLEEALDYSFNQFFNKEERSSHIVVTPNPEFLVTADQDEELAHILNEADLCLPDGIGVIYGAKYLGKSLKEKVGGYTYTMAVIERLAKQEGSIFLFGAAEGVAKKAANELQKQFPGIQIAGVRNGYFTENEETEIVDMIAKSQADYLLVCLGVAKQEKFMQKYKNELNVKAMIGNGGALDTMAGVVKRAPELWQKARLEWLYRALDDRKRFARLKSMIPNYFKLLRKAKKNR